MLINKKKRTCQLVDFIIPAHPTVKMKKHLKIYKLWDLTRERIKLKYLRVTVILILGGAFGTVPKGLEKKMEELKIRGRIEITQHN